VPMFIQLCDAMKYLHELGVVHRDVSPANIMLVGSSQRQQVKLIDLGIMKCDESWQTSSGVLTVLGDIIGNPMYLSPEQALGQASDARSDIYSLGVIMWETLAGSPPFAGLNIAEMINKHAYERFPKLTKIREGLPPDLVAILERCLEKEPAHRFQSMAELKSALLRCCGNPEKQGDRHATMRELATAIGAAIATAALLCLIMYQLFVRH
jgi:serine/threonine protein kinase